MIVDAAAYSARHQEQALLVERDGALALERYGAGFAHDKPHALYSGTKSFWGVLAAAAAHDGVLEVDEPVSATFADWADDSLNAAVTLRMLLNLTSGFAFGGLGSAVPTYDSALAMPLRDMPGTVFTYGGIPLQVFGAVLAHKLAPRNLTPHAYLRERVLDRIPVAVAQWRSLKDGTQPLPTGAFLVAHEWLAYGRFLLGGGPPVLPAAALAPCFAGSAVNARYGLGFWLYRTKGGTAVVYASGSGGQALYVAHERGTVAVRFSSGGSYRHEAFLERLFA